METFIINIHSFVDVITNSSTELFVCDTDKALETVKSMVSEMESKYPSEYGHSVHVDSMSTEDWRLQEIFDCYGSDEANMVKYLEAKGYNISKPEGEPTSKYIEISIERGCINDGLKDFIQSTFNVIYYDTDA
jgi:hypothetical protein